MLWFRLTIELFCPILFLRCMCPKTYVGAFLETLGSCNFVPLKSISISYLQAVMSEFVYSAAMSIVVSHSLFTPLGPDYRGARPAMG